jgi:hypothetical protein
MLAVLTACAITNLVMQNAIGVGLATMFTQAFNPFLYFQF